MAALTSSSTDAVVWAQYDDNAAYDVDESVTKAKLFIEACRILLRRRPNQISVDGTSTTFEAGAIQKALDKALEWWATPDVPNVRHMSFRNSRD